MKRISMEEIFLRLAELLAERSTCPRAHVGSVLTKDNRIISTGYNGAPSEQAHCAEVGCKIYKDNCTRAIHAEVNCIVFAAKNGISTDKSTLFTTHAPCISCSNMIVSSGIKKVVYLKSYHDSGTIKLKLSKINVVKYRNKLV